MQKKMNRLEALVALCGNIYYQKLINDKKVEVSKLIEFIRYNDGLDHPEFEMAAHRQFMDKNPKPKAWTTIGDILVAVNNAAFK